MSHHQTTPTSGSLHDRPHKPHFSTSPTSQQVHNLLITCVFLSSWVAVGSPLTLVLANLLIHVRTLFKLSTGFHRECWSSPLLFYVDDTFEVWPSCKAVPPTPNKPAATDQIHHGTREEQHHVFPRCASHQKSRWHPYPYSRLNRKQTQWLISIQPFIPLSTLQVCHPQHLNPLCHQHLDSL